MPSRLALIPHIAACAFALFLGGAARAEDAPAATPAQLPPGILFEGSADVDWEPYAQTLRDHIAPHWKIPREARFGKTGAAAIHFFIQADGSVTELRTVLQRGPDSLAQAARDALTQASPFPPPPLPNADDNVGGTWSFFYNMTERGRTRWWKKLKAKRSRTTEAAKSEGASGSP